MFSSWLLIFLAVFTRFWGIFWGNGFLFHPDENNMASALSQLSWQNFNPHFFAYGQFPLYLGFFSLKIFGIANTFVNSIYILRFWSAIFSFFSLAVFYRLFPSKIFVLLLIFTPGLIQLAHFGTTESLLILVFALNLYLGQLILHQPKSIYFFLISLVTGIGLATKISAIIFLTPVILALLFNKYKNKFILLLFTIIFFILFSPYNLIDLQGFIASITYETKVATGQLAVFYTTQFRSTIPYLFQLTHIFPHVAGFPMFVFSLFGFVLLITNHRSLITNKKWLITLSSTVFYFLYFGQVFTKWTRFMSPIFFIFPFLTALLINKLNNINKKNIYITYLNKFILIVSLLPGIFFMKLYFQPDIRLTASNWISQNIPANSIILSEAGNVVNLPLGNNQYQVVNYDFYNQYHPATLAQNLVTSDYIIVPSRRVFANYNYPYHPHLFDGSLGFRQIKKFAIFDDENAEETWSVFDHPTIRVYKKTRQLDYSQYESILKS